MNQTTNKKDRKEGTADQMDAFLKILSPEVENKDLDRFFNLSPDMLCIVGFDCYFKKINPSFERILGYTEEELLSQTFMNFIVEEEIEATENELKSIQGGVSNHFENRYKCKDGGIKWIAWRSVLVQEEQLIYAIARDITIEKNAELTVRNLAENLKEQVKETTDGLNYAALLQQAIFHDPTTVNRIFPESFIFHSAKDIISGDFYWFDKIGNKGFMACADCTGHGVPGAILSIMGINKLHEIIGKSETTASKILDRLNTVMSTALAKKSVEKQMYDGMDIALFAIDFDTKLLNYAGANNSLCIVRKGELIELEADKQGIGYLTNAPFTNHTYQLFEGDMIYVFSDGYSDQFGGINGKKFMRKNFKELLTRIAGESAIRQKELLNETLLAWRGSQEQTDDICVIGVRV